jgi:Cyanobacterial and plant NDH-1 subunit O
MRAICAKLGCSPVTELKSSIKQPVDSRGELMPVKRGDMVRAVREKLENSLEAKASDTRFPAYLFESKGEIVDLKGDYALVKFGKVPTPNIWLRQDQLEAFK